MISPYVKSPKAKLVNTVSTLVVNWLGGVGRGERLFKGTKKH